MGFRFRRSVRLIPGVRLNFGKRGTSVSIGGAGSTVNVSERGVRTTVGLPGTGMSYSSHQSWENPQSDAVSHGATPPAARPPSVRRVSTTGKLLILAALWSVLVVLIAAGAGWILPIGIPVLAIATWMVIRSGLS